LKDVIIRLIQDDDFAEVAEWFVARKWPVPPAGKMLPDSGYVAEKDGELLAVAWFYLTNSQVGIVDWICTNPKSMTLGLRSVIKILQHIEKISSERTNVFMHFTPNDKLAAFLKRKCGYKVTEKANVCVRRRPLEAANG
jgi:hypothetical protein